MSEPTLADFLLARITEDEADARTRSLGRGWRKQWLADCKAKRRIVGMYVGPTEDDEGNLSAIGGYGEAWLDAIRFLALPYADHPDYQQEWKP